MSSSLSVKLGILTSSSILLSACVMYPEEAKEHGFQYSATDNGVYVASEELVDNCGSWTDYNLLHDKDEKFEDVYYCTGDTSFSIYLYKGVISLNLNTLINSTYYKSRGVDKSDVFVSDEMRGQTSHSFIAFKDGGYTTELVEDMSKRFKIAEDLKADEDFEGYIVTEERIERTEWIPDAEDPNILRDANTDAVMYMGAVFATMMALKGSSYYASQGKNTSGVVVPAGVKSGQTSLGYSNGVYYTDKIREDKRHTGGTIVPYVAGSSANASASAGVTTASNSGGKVKTSSGNFSVKPATAKPSGISGARGGSGVSSGAKGGGAS